MGKIMTSADLGNTLNLIHLKSGISGTFLRYTYPTGKPVTIVIQTDKGEFFAPAIEFKSCN